ncbi:MAG: toxin co-regulated pilus biosynthesis Q family protein [Paraglaciecola sp.]|uniref:toxin co-regulated pilus biosynthesis Q family protein n=1 Tax=Paraglaciecola sp. TaxID=1920173 RepID=UPI00273FDB22|nr:toxin co-regulated pilus biosynthesis Q family protein [Paraglaciecola sp.]MDP5032212.1 toxin co-regulated pilus biosynthesis Q family protein [Paraglaciecola sp.]MDP5133386.1 toxin co-regulated pilus biosynthesis Q family protein [Paraglaciecola sp.]
MGNSGLGVPNHSESVFWAKHVALALLIIVVGGIVIFLQQRNESKPTPEGEVKSKSISDNMSKFYSEYRLSSRHPREDGLGDFVLEVKESDVPLNERLQKMESIQKPISGRWVGEYKHRTFKAGTTLRSAITNYAQAEGMQVIWELDQDFIVKHQFQMEDTILGSLQSISNAIDSNFDGKVKAYVCPKQRSLVITQKKSEYLNQECVEARM